MHYLFVCFFFINHYSRSLTQGLEGFIRPKYRTGIGKRYRDTGFDQNTVRGTGNVKRDTGFVQNVVRDSGNAKRDTGFDQNTV